MWSLECRDAGRGPALQGSVHALVLSSSSPRLSAGPGPCRVGLERLGGSAPCLLLSPFPAASSVPGVVLLPPSPSWRLLASAKVVERSNLRRLKPQQGSWGQAHTSGIKEST